MRQRAAQRGFTIIELMIVVAIIAVLAVVVIPSFMKETKRGKAKSEVSPMFAELVTREEANKVETGLYVAAPACPPSSSSSGTDMTSATCATTTGQPWVTLRVQPSERKLTCSYTISIGNSGTNPSTHASWPSWVATTVAPSSPATNWYFINAVCPNTEYFQASWEGKIRAKDGK